MDLPAGYLTLLLTDIAGSAAAWDADPDGTDAAQQHHDGVLAAAVAAHSGLVLKQKGEGDSTFSVFEDAVDALSAAITFLARLERDAFALPVRVGIHSGDLVPRADDYYGPVPNRTARIRALGDGRQVLLSAATEALVRDRLPDSVVLVDLGEHELRGLSRAEHVYAVSHPELAPVTPIGEPTALGNLPASIDRFVGRDEERILLDKALREHRLVTVVGAGGIGKSRLALQVAAEQSGEHPAGTWVLDVADIGGTESLAATLTTLLGLPPARDPIAAIAEALARPSLIVLDTCEADVDAAAEFAEQLLRLQPRTVVLATSREPLGAQGEAVLRLEPMTLDTGARELFLTRAAAADLTLGAVDEGFVDRICNATDGVPLAIELVAGRLAVDDVANLAAIVDDLDALLRPDAARRRTGPARQRTLHDTIRWSVDALSDDDRALLVQLTVFAGGWPEGAATEVCGADDSARSVTAGLQALTRRSLVVVDRSDHDRLRLLDTVREAVWHQYGPPPDAVRDRHLTWATARAEAIEHMPIATRRSRYDADHANLRAAFAHAVATNAAGDAHRLIYAQANVWAARRAFDEAGAATDAALALGASPHRAAALAAAGFLAVVGGDLDAAERHYEECSELADVDPEIRSDVMNGLVMVAKFKGRPMAEVIDLATRAVAAARHVAHTNVLAVALNNLSTLLQSERPLEEALAVLREGAELERALDTGTATRLNYAALLIEMLLLGEAEQTLDDIRDAATDPMNRGVWFENTIKLAAERARPDDVVDGLNELLGLLDADAATLQPDRVSSLAWLAADLGYVADARRLLRRLPDAHASAPHALLEFRTGEVATARAALGEIDPSTAAWQWCVVAAEIAIADGEHARVPAIVAPAIAREESIGRARAVKRLQEVLARNS